jgi:hypothetical protein
LLCFLSIKSNNLSTQCSWNIQSLQCLLYWRIICWFYSRFNLSMWYPAGARVMWSKDNFFWFKSCSLVTNTICLQLTATYFGFHTKTIIMLHQYIYIYIYIYMCVCVSVCVCVRRILYHFISISSTVAVIPCTLQLFIYVCYYFLLGLQLQCYVALRYVTLPYLMY